MVPLVLALIALTFCLAHANVEKAVFVAPPSSPFPRDASIDNLLLTPLSPSLPDVRVYLNASFPTTTSPKGIESWFLLHDLVPGTRYEVRVCWLATQPTSFWLYTYGFEEVFDTPELATSLSTYGYARHDAFSESEMKLLRSRRERGSSDAATTTFLFLHIFAAADYFTLNQTLMESVPPVPVDVILDPYLLNVLPQSLLPTTVYLVVLAAGGWFLSARLAAWLTRKTSQIQTPAVAISKKSN